MRGRRLSRLAGDRGQAAVELIGAAPLIVAVVLAVAQALAYGSANEAAHAAAHAGAVAIAQERDPEQAARKAVPDVARKRLSVEVRGREVRVRLRPRAYVPGAGSLLVAHARMTAGAP